MSDSLEEEGDAPVGRYADPDDSASDLADAAVREEARVDHEQGVAPLQHHRTSS
jgi:hypothetical protein